MQTTFYTTAEQEAKLEKKYEKEVLEKQREMDASKRRNKYTSRAFIHRPDVCFFVDLDAGKVIYDAKEGENAPKESLKGGKTYTIDYQMHAKLESWSQKHKKYWIRFCVTGKYGPTIDYCGGKDVYPCVLEAETGETLSLDDEDNYSIGVL